jgi:hypothetical protein
MKHTVSVIIAVLILSSSVVVISLQQQQAFAPRDCPGCGQFGKLTGEFMVNVVKAIGNPNDGPEPYIAVRQLTAQFERDAITALRIGNPDTVPGLLDTYT